MKSKQHTTLQCRLRAAFYYDPETGKLTRRVAAGRHGCHRAGSEVGTPNGNGYIRVRFQEIRDYAHRLIWVYNYGDIPKDCEVDHRNLNRSDNRLHNLRLADNYENMHNRQKKRSNVSGFKGVTYRPRRKSNQYESRICSRGVYYNLGFHKTAEAAHAAYCQAALKLHKEFARTL